MEQKLLDIINMILEKAEGKREPYEKLDPDTSLRQDLLFDSLDLAEFTVRIEDDFGVDIFEDGNVDKMHEVIAMIQRESKS